MTAVEEFARQHEADALPANARYYRDLIPLEQPQPGQQFGFEVDLDACTGCKACVTACHGLNGLDDDESWRTVGLLHGGEAATPFQQTVTTACHHCVDPACLNGCPVDAYDKNPVTGIVSHLDDQCIGCGYCTLTCPYEVPRINADRGIVRKCDMCRGRLEVGEAPACVQACPNGAIKIAVVDTVALEAEAATGARLVPGAPPSSITVPTTVYLTERPHLRDLQAADDFALRPAQAHPPLAVMLVLTQLAVGAVATDVVVRLLADSARVAPLRGANALVAAAMGVLALGASVLHLGRPRYAYRAIIGISHSWLSREVVAFGVFAPLVLLSARASLALGVLAVMVGVVGVGCSVMVYAVTHRRWWRASATATKFGLTTVVCGVAAVLATSMLSPLVQGSADGQQAAGELARPLVLSLVAASVLKLGYEASVFRHRWVGTASDLQRTARLLAGELGAMSAWRFAIGFVGGIGLPLLTLAVTASSPGLLAGLTAMSLAMVVAGELIERGQFFRAVVAPRMPGGIA